MKRHRICLTVMSALLSTLTTPPAFACLNDQDTLAREARARPDALNAITGRFERNPPLYYQMRITRESSQIAANPADLDKYDDVAVAYDRLGDDDGAIAWIEKKRAHLPTYNPHDANLKEQWYRYYANVGTFWMHRWAHHGADLKQIGDVKVASAFIEKAIAIKPDAHFGREKYQLIIMKWIIDPQGDTLAGALSDCRHDEAVTALSGLIELGGAWQSFDVYYALCSILHSDEDDTHALGTLAAFRADEIVRAGGNSIHPETLPEKASLVVDSTGSAEDYDVYTEYRDLRAEADRWQADRTSYMMARLTKGDHPDIDPNFWTGYHPQPTPDIIPPHELRRRKMVALENTVLIGSAVAIVIAAGAVIIYRRRKRSTSGL